MILLKRDRAAKMAKHVVGKDTRSAVYSGHLLSAVAVCDSLDGQQTLSRDKRVRHIEVPTRRFDRIRFLKQWAREQRRRALAGGTWNLLVLPAFATAAMAQSEEASSLSSAEGVVDATMQPDGSLLVTLEDGSMVLVPEGQYSITAEGHFLVDAEFLAEAGTTATGTEAVLGGGALFLGAIAAGGSGGASSTTSGFVIDGYIADATVFRDENGNGILDPGEASTVTDDQGAFSDLGGDLDAPLVAVGGVDISTGLNTTATFGAPAGATILSPLTALVQEILEADTSGETSVEDAVALVNAALGLDDSTDLLNEDPIETGNDDLFVAGAKVVNIINIGVAAGAGEEQIIGSLAAAIRDADETTPDNLLNNGAAIEGILADAFAADPDAETPSDPDIAAVANTAANGNAAIDALILEAVANGEDVIDPAADVQQVIQTGVSSGIADQIEDDDQAVSEISQKEIETAARNALDVVNGQASFPPPFTEDFNAGIEVGEQAAGVWYVDRFPPAAFEIVEDFGDEIDDDGFSGESVLKMTTDADDQKEDFSQTQGRKLDLPAGTVEVSIQLYIDPDWEPEADDTAIFRQAGLWTTAFSSEGDVSAFPIIEFRTNAGEGQFWAWTGVLWRELPTPDGIPYGEFVELKIALNSDGSITYSVGSQSYTSDDSDQVTAANTASLGNVILQVYNQDSLDPDASREPYSVYWDNLSAKSGIVDSDTDLSNFADVRFDDLLYEVAPGVELTLTVAQADGLQIGGDGTLKLVGPFDPNADLSGITTAIIDTSGVEAISTTSNPAMIEGTSTGAVVEDSADTLTVSGVLTINDQDVGEDVFIVQSGVASDNGFGTFTLDAYGSWTYNADNALQAIQDLGDGETLTDSFTARSADGTEQVVEVTITGAAEPVELSDVESGIGGFVINGVSGGDEAGFSVSSAGDVNGDGLDDVIVGAWAADPNDNLSGASYVVFGKVDGTPVDLATLGADEGFVINGGAQSDTAGVSVSGAGDINGDGLDDLIVGADGANSNGTLSGASYVVFGKSDGNDVELADLGANDNAGGFIIEGATVLDRSGRMVSDAGDVNGDGLDDIIIGARGADPNGSASGASYVVFGKADGTAVDLSVLDDDDDNSGFVINGAVAGDQLNNATSDLAVSAAGDVNGDGFGDLIVGARGADPNGSFSGTTYVVFGKEDGTAIELSALEDDDDTTGFAINGVTTFDASGTSVSAAGDVNGDGFDDLIVGAPGAEANGVSSGASFVIFGGDFSGVATEVGTTGNDLLIGSEAADAIFAGLGDDTLDGGGGEDRLSGGAGADTFVVSDEDGTTTILDFDPSDGDKLDLSDFGLSASVFDALVQADGPGDRDARIELDENTVVILADVGSSDILSDVLLPSNLTLT